MATVYLGEDLKSELSHCISSLIGSLKSDFAFVRQTVFPRMRRALIGLLEGVGAPDRLELLERRVVGDDRALQYRALYGERRFRVIVSLGPEGGLTALRVVPEG